MKVLIVHPQMGFYGGAETVIVHLAHYLKALDIKTSILTMTSSSNKEYEGLDIILPPKNKQVHYRIRSDKFIDYVELMKIWRVLRGMVTKHIMDYDIINPHNFPAVWALPKTSKPVVWMCNELLSPWHRSKKNRRLNRLIDIGVRCFDRYIVNSKVNKAVVADKGNARRYYEYYRSQPEIINYGIEGKFFAGKSTKIEEDKLKKRFGLNNSGFYIIQAAMISPSKKQLDVLEVIQNLKNVLPNVKVIFSGRRDKENLYTKSLDAYIRENNLEDRVSFTGHVSKSELRALYNLSSIAIFHGIGQGSWLGPFEALSAGKPVIVSKELPCSELINREDIGVVSDNFYDSIVEVYKNYNQHLEKARTGKELVLKKLTYNVFCEKFLNVFESCL